MKKQILSFLVSGMVVSLLVACGPSAEEKAAAEQHLKDSVAAVMQAQADSMLAAQQKAMQDSLAMVATQDSIKAVEDSIAAAKGNKPKPKKSTPEKINEETKKATQGRG